MYYICDCSCIFSSFSHNLSVIGGAFLLESIIWCMWIVRCPEFGGCPLFGSSKCIESTGIAIGISDCGPLYNRCPLLGVSVNGKVPLYIYIMFFPLYLYVLV